MRHILILTAFLLIYGLMHAYALHRAARAFPQRVCFWRWLAPIALLSLAPIILRLLEQYGALPVARLLAWPVYLFMGWLFLFVVSAALFDLAALGRRLYQKTATLLSSKRPVPELSGIDRRNSARIAFFAPLLLSLGITGYGLWEAESIRVEEVRLYSDRIPAGMELRLVQISDLHLGLLLGKKKIERVRSLIEKTGPDVLVCTGDLVDGRDGGLAGLDRPLAQLSAPLGKFAVLGNHEYYRGLDHSLAFLAASGFTVLRGEYRVLPGLPVGIAGIDDTSAFGSNLGDTAAETTLLAGLPAENFNILLKHRPRPPKAQGRPADLQLSGHTHHGQIFPFILPVRLIFPLPSGLVRLQSGGLLYTSRGTGTWGPPVRFLAPPEITLFRLLPAPKTVGNSVRPGV